MDFARGKSSTGGWEVPELPELRLPQQAAFSGSHLYPSSAPRSLYKWTVVSEAHRLNGSPYPYSSAFPLPRDPWLTADHAGVQPVMPRECKLDVPCEYYFSPSGWCPYGHSCRYSHSVQVWLADRTMKGLGRKRKLHEI